MPKSVSGNGVHCCRSPELHSEGASAIHSAVLVSGAVVVIATVLVTDWPVVRSLR